MIRVLIVNDQRTVRQEIQAMLATEADLQVVGTAANGRKAIAQVGTAQPDVVLMEVQMPVMDGCRATRQIVQQYPQCKVLIFTGLDDVQSILDAFKAGVKGYLLRSVDNLAQSIRQVHQGHDLMMGSGLLKKFAERVVIVDRSRFAEPSRSEFDPCGICGAARLTAREQEILRAMNHGMSTREIAEALVLSDSTVRTHISNMMKRLDIEDRFQLRRYASQVFGEQPHSTEE
jgi:DNA-binding NarL/FixJ family response regulator